MNIFIRLFLTFFKVGAFGFGGGYGILSLMQEEMVHNQAWLTKGEFLDIVAIAEMTPGPIAINMGTFVGFRMAGFFGALTATFSVVLPSFIIVLFLIKLFFKYQSYNTIQDALNGIRPAILAIIASAAIVLIGEAINDIYSFIIAILVFMLMTANKINPIILLILSGLAGIIIYK